MTRERERFKFIFLYFIWIKGKAGREEERTIGKRGDERGINGF